MPEIIIKEAYNSSCIYFSLVIVLQQYFSRVDKYSKKMPPANHYSSRHPIIQKQFKGFSLSS